MRINNKLRKCQTCSIISADRTPGSMISDSANPRTEVILENLFFSSVGESIKFKSSNNDAATSFSCTFEQFFN